MAGEEIVNARIVIDGQQIIKKISPNTRIRVRKANSHAKFIRFLNEKKNQNYFIRLRKKIIGTLKIPLDDSPEE